MKEKSNLPPGILPHYVRIYVKHVEITEANVSLNLTNLHHILIEMCIKGDLKAALHKAGKLPLKLNDSTSICADMAELIIESKQNGGDLEAAFYEAGILSRNPKPAKQVASPSLKKTPKA